MKIKLFNAILFVLMLLLVSAPEQYAERANGKKANSLSKITGSPSYTRFNINKISTWIKNDGESDINQNGNSGFVYPKGTNRACVFQSGFLYGGKINGEIRVGGSTYNQGQKPGAIINGVAEDPNLDHVRIYRVRRDYATGNLTPEALDEGVTVDEVYQQYEADWNEWPVAYGAPYEDVDGDGSYDPTVDIPGKPGADQTIWFVNNDLDAVAAQQLYGSLPMGVEMQATIFGYNRIGPLGSILFREYKIINKSSTPFTDFYVCMWSDPDVGDATDDYSGCDTTLSLGYTYNGNPSDATYGLNPPATGFDFFQGPVVPGEPTDTAKALGRRIPGAKNLGMSAFFFFINSDPVYSDPNLGEYAEGTLEMYNLFQGKIGTTGQFFTDPNTGLPTTFTLSGDPITGTGWVDGQLHTPGDRRIGMVAGPFTMAAGDTQEVVVGQIAAGATAGVSSLQAVTILKQYDQIAQNTYDADFQVPAPPKAPVVRVGEFDEQIVLTWGSDEASVKTTENHSFQGYTFQGYNVYQLPFANAGIKDATKLATFDIVDEIKNIVVKEIDENTGVEISVVSQTGSDSGIQRFFIIDRDAIKNQKLVNGKKYYFAVTSYAYNPSELAVPQVLENDPVALTIIPHSPDPGVRYTSEIGDHFSATRTQGKSDGTVNVSVVDPSLLTGHDYRVNIQNVQEDDGHGGTHTVTTWSLTDVTTGQAKLTNQHNLSGDNDYIFVDGLQVVVAGPPPGVKPDDAFSTDDESLWGWDIPAGTRRWTWAGGADGLGFEGFQHAIGYASAASVFGGSPMAVAPDQLVPVLIKLASVPTYVDYDPAFDPNDENVSYGYRYGRGFAAAPAKPEFAPHIVNAVGGYSYQGYEKSVPLSAWDVSDPNNPRRLTVLHLENNQSNGLVDGKYWPGNHAAYDNTATNGPREWLWISKDDYTETPDPAYQAELIGNATIPVMYYLTVGNRSGSPYSPNGTGTDQFLIVPTNPLTPNDVYTFSAPANENSVELAKEDVKKINVFPNPYYGVNSEELNKYQRFVTFNHLPAKATLRIFNLAGQLVRTIEKNSNSQFVQWDLLNKSGLPVASGLYIVYIDMPDLGTTKTVKAAIIQEQQILDRF